MRIDEKLSVVVSHGRLELIDPYARINSENFALQSFQTLSVSLGAQ